MIESSSKGLPKISQNKAIFGVLPSINLPKVTENLLSLPNTYPKLTKDLPKIYKRFSEDLLKMGHLPS